QKPEKRRDDLAEGIVLQLDLRGLGKQVGAEHALDRAQIAAGLARDMALESVVTEHRRIVVEAEEQGRRNRRRAVLYRQQVRALPAADADGRVRGAEI